MYPNRKVDTNVVIQLDEHATQETLNESLSLIYHAYLIHCQKNGLPYCQPETNALGQQTIPEAFTMALHKYLRVNDLYLSPLSKVKETYAKILNQ